MREREGAKESSNFLFRRTGNGGAFTETEAQEVDKLEEGVESSPECAE